MKKKKILLKNKSILLFTVFRRNWHQQSIWRQINYTWRFAPIGVISLRDKNQRIFSTNYGYKVIKYVHIFVRLRLNMYFLVLKAVT